MQKCAIVTGAARGIGLATAKQFLEQGYVVSVVDRDETELEKALDELGKGAIGLPHDISFPEKAEAMVAETLEEFGRVDVLVNNAGVADFGPVEDTDFARWRRVMETNLDGVFLCSQAATPALRETKGAILNIASISGLRASTLRVAYGTSKAAVIHLTQQQAAELGEYGIRAKLRMPRPGTHQAGDGRAHTGHHRRISRRDPAEPLWNRGRTGQCHHLPVLGQGQLCHRPDRGGRRRLPKHGRRPARPAQVT